jgi:hypothetical protein
MALVCHISTCKTQQNTTSSQGFNDKCAAIRLERAALKSSHLFCWILSITILVDFPDKSRRL